ncbi:CoA-binding protein [Alicyclobacillus sp. SO9]|uniref:CoA-binding protein n=1 Tax=Alicyclobacillus sp. SO9 TaxID=2665646 RepID=UPI0018E7C53A|nr:CoA-binding protein [Alicyclobacillus sp. SO9]QQE77061.1 CoA-binding protein [Alicyclobacillus sp. SO9]
MSIQDAQLTDLLTNVHSIAAVGVTNHAASSGYEVLSYQQSQGYDVTPVNPQESSILGMPCAKSVNDIQDPVDLVNVFSETADLDEVVEDAANKNAKALWLQPGVANETAEKRAHKAGMTVVKDKCFRQVHQTLMAHKPF